MDCKTAQARLPGFQDGSMDEALEDQLLAHLGGCPECRRVLQDLDVADAALQDAVSHMAMREDFTDRVLAELSEPRGRARPVGPRAVPAWGTVVAVAAAVLVVVAVGAFRFWPRQPEKETVRTTAFTVISGARDVQPTLAPSPTPLPTPTISGVPVRTSVAETPPAELAPAATSPAETLVVETRDVEIEEEIAGRPFVVDNGSLKPYDGPTFIKLYGVKDGTPEVLVDAFPRREAGS